MSKEVNKEDDRQSWKDSLKDLREKLILTIPIDDNTDVNKLIKDKEQRHA